LIAPETIASIFDAARIDEVVGDFVTLKKRGVNLLGLCPFHNEKTPSFTVSPAKGIYKCFGCGAGGNSVNFVMEHEHLTYPDALRYLAKKYNIEIEEKESTPEQQKEQNEKESLFVVTAFAENFFAEQLHDSEEGKSVGLSYLTERGFTPETIKKFKLGYAPDSRNKFTHTAIETGYKTEFLEKTGLSKSREGEHYDGFRGRVMFPIHSLTGRPVAFGGRTLKADKKIPKYVNTPECDIYHKSKILYGLFFAKKSIIEIDNCFLTEGYTDVISLHQCGIENVVASSGTSLTQEQVKLIGRYTKNITILYDGDAAGIKASFRGIDMILEEGMNVRVVLFPDGEDPDSFSKKNGADEIKEYVLKNAQDFIVFKTNLLFADVKNDPVKKATLIHEIVNSIALIPDHIARSLYVKETSVLLDISEKALISELNKVLRNRLKKKTQATTEEAEQIITPQPVLEETRFISENSIEFQERDIIHKLLNFGTEMIYIGDKSDASPQEKEEAMFPVAEVIIEELKTDNISFEHPIYNQILDFYKQALTQDKIPDSSALINHENKEIRNTCVGLISSKYELHDWGRRNIYVIDEKSKLRRAVYGAIYAYRTKKILQMIEQNQNEIKSAFSEGKDASSLIIQRKKLDEIKIKLAKEQSIVILK
jgi:DNA primase